MFCIESGFRFKLHYVSNKDIAEEVKSDLASRPTDIGNEGYAGDTMFANGEIVIVEPKSSISGAMWDPGGMCLMKDEVFSFPLGDITIECKSQHFEQFIEWVCKDTEYNRIRGNKYQYHKLHGYWTCICITPEEFNNLREMVKDPEKLIKGRSVWDKLQKGKAEAGVLTPTDEPGKYMVAKPLKQYMGIKSKKSLLN